MDRLNYDQSQVDYCRSVLSNTGPYIGKSEPLPGTALKLDDDVMWLDCIPFRVCWGYETADYFFGFNPDIDTDSCSYSEGIYITDRAPKDPYETPMPIYPQQAQQPQHAKKHDPKRALHEFLQRLSPEAQRRVRKMVQEKRPELLK